MTKGTLLASCAVIAMAAVAARASAQSTWSENAGDPVHVPYVGMSSYYPSVVLDVDQFSGHGAPAYFKMWHQGPGGIALSTSNDGVNWTLAGITNLGESYHPCVVYDADGFGGGAHTYRIWFWTGTAGTTPDVIQTSVSADGLNWQAPQPITQDALQPIVDGASPGYSYHLYGPGFALYNRDAASVPGQPLTFPYVMYYDTSTEGSGPGASVEQVGLATSSDGISWTRFGAEPVLIPTGAAGEWDGTYAYRPSLVRVGAEWQMYYSGSNHLVDPGTTPTYARGIGLARSADGVSWTRDAGNPIFYYADGVPWRTIRTYTPFVLLSRDGDCLQMWFTGANATAGAGIGYATQCGLAPPRNVPVSSRPGLALLVALVLGLGALKLRLG